MVVKLRGRQFQPMDHCCAQRLVRTRQSNGSATARHKTEGGVSSLAPPEHHAECEDSRSTQDDEEYGLLEPNNSRNCKSHNQTEQADLH
jgi:hypothetical protein